MPSPATSSRLQRQRYFSIFHAIFHANELKLLKLRTTQFGRKKKGGKGGGGGGEADGEGDAPSVDVNTEDVIKEFEEQWGKTCSFG